MNCRRMKRLALSALLVLTNIFVAHTAGAHAATQRRGRAARSTAAPAAATTTAHAAVYSCPMHPSVKSKTRGKCPKCGMALRPVRSEAPAAPVSTGAGEEAAAPAETKKAEAAGSLRIPDTTVYDQNGRRLNFYTDLVKGKTVAINFIFTTCTTICPPLSATFRKVQRELGERAGSEVELISVSVDPTTDTPERLKSFSAKFGAGPGWTFVTGSKPEIDELLRALGASVNDKNDHTPMVLIGNEAAGYWTRTYGLAPASTLLKVITEATAKGSAVTPPPPRQRDAVTAQAASPSAAPEKSVAGAAASYFPNLELLTQDGKPVRFYEDLLKGKIVLVNFMFTTCTGVCTPMTANLVKVQRYLGEHVGREVLMLSISVDPQIDSPPVLKKYAEGFKAQPGWYFLTGKKENVDRVLYKLGGYVEDKMQHSATLIIGNERSGDWMKIHAMSSPAEIAAAVKRMIEAQEKASAAVSP